MKTLKMKLRTQDARNIAVSFSLAKTVIEKFDEESLIYFSIYDAKFVFFYD